MPAFEYSGKGINHNENNSHIQFKVQPQVERARKRGNARGLEGVHESYAQCGCAARLGEFVTASGGYLRRGWVYPNPFFR